MWVDAPLTNEAYGYPNRGDLRRTRPRALACLHITANPNTPPATAKQERDYANRAGSEGPSAHTYADRPGGGVHAVPTRFAAWSNGVLRNPKTSVPGIADVVAFQQSGFNPNEFYVREIEMCGRYGAYPITEAQIADVAALVAADALLWDLPISRSTIHLHSDLDTVNRPNCPVPAAQAEAWVAAFIAKANEAFRVLVMGVLVGIDELLAELKKQIDALESERDAAIVRRDEAVIAMAKAETERDILAAKIIAARAALL
jgi:hypothetical protein